MFSTPPPAPPGDGQSNRQCSLPRRAWSPGLERFDCLSDCVCFSLTVRDCILSVLYLIRRTASAYSAGCGVDSPWPPAYDPCVRAGSAAACRGTARHIVPVVRFVRHATTSTERAGRQNRNTFPSLVPPILCECVFYPYLYRILSRSRSRDKLRYYLILSIIILSDLISSSAC